MTFCSFSQTVFDSWVFQSMYCILISSSLRDQTSSSSLAASPAFASAAKASIRSCTAARLFSNSSIRRGPLPASDFCLAKAATARARNKPAP